MSVIKMYTSEMRLCRLSRLQLLRNISVILGHAMSVYSNRLLVGAPKSYDPLQPGVKSPGVLFRCPIDGAATTCTEVIVDTTGKFIETYQNFKTQKIQDSSGNFYDFVSS